MPIVLLLLVVIIALTCYLDGGVGDKDKGEDNDPRRDTLSDRL
jgi:hypothetical protein